MPRPNSKPIGGNRGSGARPMAKRGPAGNFRLPCTPPIATDGGATLANTRHESRPMVETVRGGPSNFKPNKTKRA